MSDAFGLTMEQWEAYDEPFKISYREYVGVQSKKDSDAYSVKAALARANFYDKAESGWKSILKMHYGAASKGQKAIDAYCKELESLAPAAAKGARSSLDFSQSLAL